MPSPLGGSGPPATPGDQSHTGVRPAEYEHALRCAERRIYAAESIVPDPDASYFLMRAKELANGVKKFQLKYLKYAEAMLKNYKE